MAVTADVSSPQKSTVERLPHPNMKASKQSADAMECASTGSGDGASDNDIVPTVSHDMSTAISSDDSVDSKQQAKPKKRKSEESESSNNSNEEESGKKSKKKKKKVKDPNAPKRNVSAYLHYSSAKRGDVKESQPDLSFGEITKVVTASWKALSVEERVPWDEKAAVDKKRYEDEVAAYKDSEQALDWQARMAAEEGKKQSTSVSNSGKNAKEKSKKKSEAKEKSKKKSKKQQVKKPMSAHMHFSLANRADVKECQPDLSASEVTSTVATNWKALSPDERSFWEEKAAADEERYQKELAAQDMLEG